MGTIIGIDLGTTYSLVGVIQNGQPILIPNKLGELLTPSAVGLDAADQLLVGARARARRVLDPSSVITSFKRDMGTSKTHRLGKQDFKPEELSALVLKSLKEDAQDFLGLQIEECVISVPAYFGEAQRQATKAAAQLAGLQVKRLINEPTAAALAYGLSNPEKETKALVLDLGGGTFDVTILEILEGVVEVKASAGDTQLGGDDFDRTLSDYVYKKAAGALSTDPLTRARVLEICQRVKHQLSQKDTAEFQFAQYTQTITRQEAQDLWADLRERLRRPINQALRDSGLDADEIEEVLLVGGSTRLPLVTDLAKALFECPILNDLPPDETVARGAAIAAGLFDLDHRELEIGLTDVNPFSLGTSCLAAAETGQEVPVFEPIIPRGSVIPCSRIKTFTTAGDYQTEIQLDIYQGEHIQVERNTKIGTMMVQKIPRAPKGTQAIDVRFTYDLSGLLEVEVTLKSTGQVVSQIFNNSQGQMTPQQIEAARRAMAQYKIAPRDEGPNKAVLERAEALAVTLSGPPLEFLKSLMVNFLAALDTQDPKVIAAARETFSHELTQLEWEN